MWEENPNGGKPTQQVGTENPICMQGSRSDVRFEPGSTEVNGRVSNVHQWQYVCLEPCSWKAAVTHLPRLSWLLRKS